MLNHIFMMCFCLFLTSSIIITFRINITISAFFLINIHYPENLPSIYRSCICTWQNKSRNQLSFYTLCGIFHCLFVCISFPLEMYLIKKEMNCCRPNCVYLIKASHTEKENSNARYILCVDFRPCLKY